VRIEFDEALSVDIEERSEVTNTLDEAWRTLSEG